MARYGKPIHVRVTEEERATIEKNAKRAKMKFSAYVRAAALGELETSPESAGPQNPGSGEAPGRITQKVGPAGSIPDPGKTVLETPHPDEIEPRRENEAQYIARRGNELHAQGRTQIVARAEAAAEWRRLTGDAA